MATQIVSMLEPAYATVGEPTEGSLRQAWRQGLALLVDARLQEGNEFAALRELQRACPEEVWRCQFGIPDRALASARAVQEAPQVDEHARVAMQVATGFLYVDAGDRRHGDAILRQAIGTYLRLLEGYDGWDGARTRTVTPKLRLKTVGAEFYDYRNRMQRLVHYTADWWGMRVVRGDVGLPEALGACEYCMFRALVRLRADKEANPINIVREERLRPDYMMTVGEWLSRSPYEPQAAWELDRAKAVRSLGQELQDGRALMKDARALAAQGAYNDAAALAGQILQRGVTYPDDRAEIRLNIEYWYEKTKNWEKAGQLLRENLADLQADSPYRVGSVTPLVRDSKWHLMDALLHMEEYDEALALGQEILQDPTLDDARTVEVLYSVGMGYTLAGREADALAILARMGRVQLQDAQNSALLGNRIDLLRSNMRATGFAVPPRSPGAGPSTACCDE